MEHSPVIELREVSIYHISGLYSRKRWKATAQELILSDVNVAIYPGELVYLIGKIGSGKSSFLKTLYAELPLVHGRGQVAGYDLETIRKRQVPHLRRRMGIVFQDYQLLGDRDLYDNLRFVLKATGWKREPEMKQRIMEVLGMVNLAQKAYKFPHELSGGEQQRLSIARALLNKPDLIVADEPTGNLDHVATSEVMKILYEIAQSGCAVVMSTHNISNIQKYPSRTLRFKDGRVEEIDIEPLFPK